MTEPLPEDTWAPRDLPVLRAIIRLCESSDTYTAGPDAIQQETGLDAREVQLAARALTEEGLVDGLRAGNGDTVYFNRISGEARRRAGTWPTPESLAERIVAELERIAENTDDADERTRLQKIVAGLKSGSEKILIAAIATAIGGGLT